MADMAFVEARANVARLLDGASPILKQSLELVLFYADCWIELCGEEWEWEE